MTAGMAASVLMKAAHRSKRYRQDASQLEDDARKYRDRLAPLIDQDAREYDRAVQVRKGHGDPTQAMHSASEVPAIVVEVAVQLADLAVDLAQNGNPNLRADALGAANLAASAAVVAARLVSANVPDSALAQRCSQAAAKSMSMVLGDSGC